MTTWTRQVWRIGWRALLLIALLGGGLVWFMNRDTSWDASVALAKPGSVTEPRVGVVIVAIAQPATFEKTFWLNATNKILKKVVPWPINWLARSDRGVVLVDPARPYAPSEFVPTRLLDIDGREADASGVKWIDRYHRRETMWVAPNDSIPHDTGYFLWYEGKQGMPTVAAKSAAKARYLYYAPLRDGFLPHGEQTRALADVAMTELRTRHRQVVATAFANTFDPVETEQAVRRVLDSGVNVIVFGAGQPIYSDFEEMRSAFSAMRDTVEQWRRENGNKPVRIVVAPWMATERSFDELWLDHFAATVPPATAPGQTALGIISLHGLPPEMAKKDSWSQRWPLLAARLKPRMVEILKAKGYATARAEVGAEGFADAIEDPDNEIVSLNELYREARAKKYALAIALPVEFFAENTDTLFSHQALFFDGLGGYRAYAPPPKDTDWMKPYVRTLKDGGTTIIYAGAPGGAAVPRGGTVLADAIGRVFPR